MDAMIGGKRKGQPTRKRQKAGAGVSLQARLDSIDRRLDMLVSLLVETPIQPEPPLTQPSSFVEPVPNPVPVFTNPQDASYPVPKKKKKSGCPGGVKAFNEFVKKFRAELAAKGQQSNYQQELRAASEAWKIHCGSEPEVSQPVIQPPIVEEPASDSDDSYDSQDSEDSEDSDDSQDSEDSIDAYSNVAPAAPVSVTPVPSQVQMQEQASSNSLSNANTMLMGTNTNTNRNRNRNTTRRNNANVRRNTIPSLEEEQQALELPGTLATPIVQEQPSLLKSIQGTLSSLLPTATPKPAEQPVPPLQNSRNSRNNSRSNKNRGMQGQTISYDDDTSEYGMRRVDIDGNKYYLAEDTGELFLRNSNNSLGEEVGRWNVNRIRYA